MALVSALFTSHKFELACSFATCSAREFFAQGPQLPLRSLPIRNGTYWSAVQGAGHTEDDIAKFGYHFNEFHMSHLSSRTGVV